MPCSPGHRSAWRCWTPSCGGAGQHATPAVRGTREADVVGRGFPGSHGVVEAEAGSSPSRHSCFPQPRAEPKGMIGQVGIMVVRQIPDQLRGALDLGVGHAEPRGVGR